MIQNLKLKYVVIASFIIGVMFTLSFGLYGSAYFDIYLHRVPVGGEVININLDENTTTISYEANDMTIKKTIHFIDSGIKEGDYVTIYYDSRNPQNSFIEEQIDIILFFFGLGIAFLIVFLITFILYKYRNKYPKEIKNDNKKNKSVKKSSKKL